MTYNSVGPTRAISAERRQRRPRPSSNQENIPRNNLSSQETSKPGSIVAQIKQWENQAAKSNGNARGSLAPLRNRTNDSPTQPHEKKDKQQQENQVESHQRRAVRNNLGKSDHVLHNKDDNLGVDLAGRFEEEQKKVEEQKKSKSQQENKSNVNQEVSKSQRDEDHAGRVERSKHNIAEGNVANHTATTVKRQPNLSTRHEHNELLRKGSNGISPSTASHVSSIPSRQHHPGLLEPTQKSISSSNIGEDGFDFAIVLAPQDEYAFWAERLNFQADEKLENDPDDVERGRKVDKFISFSSTLHQNMNVFENRSMYNADHINPPRCTDSCQVKTTPLNGTSHRNITSSGRKRKSVFERAVDESIATPTHPIFHGSTLDSGSKGNQQDLSNQNIPYKSTPDTLRRRGKSAMGLMVSSTTTPTSPPRRKWGSSNPQPPALSSSDRRRIDILASPPVRSLLRPPTTSMKMRHNPLGHHNTHTTLTNDTSTTTTRPMPTVWRMKGVNVWDFPSQVVPRGIAARVNGLIEFLEALNRGIVLKRHKPHAEAAYVKLYTRDGGDTINFDYVKPEDAHLSLMEQGVRYNKSKRWISSTNSGTSHTESVFPGPKEVSRNKVDYQQDQMESQSLPDHLAAKQYREDPRNHTGVRKIVSNVALQMLYSGKVRASEILVVHPARHTDPFTIDDDDIDNSDEDGSRQESSEKGGTWSLRSSKSVSQTNLTFSLVLPPKPILRAPGQLTSSDDNWGEKWQEGEGSPRSFRYVDFEAATEGEYWLVFRGFLLLHRDAATGRFAAQRASGYSSHSNRRELEKMNAQRSMDEREREKHKEGHSGNEGTNRVMKFMTESMKSHRWLSHNLPFRQDVGGVNDEGSMTENSAAGELRKELFPVSNMPRVKTKFELDANPNTPPPSDYFLGFQSEGTQIWARLRQAGLETQRIYNLDTRRVMIKIWCPKERIQDVAEVLRLRLRTRDGTYAPFRESVISQYVPCEERLPGDDWSSPSLFRSSERQTIIDFIIRSRIRDSGAELGEGSKLGRQIEMRVPLHVRSQLETLCRAWVTYWKADNWYRRDSSGMSVLIHGNEHPFTCTTQQCETRQSISGPTVDLGNSPSSSEERNGQIPSFFSRLIFGSFSQPLDSIQQYFGEEVAFYSAWVQHISYHLVSLAFFGSIVFICQISTGNWDHPIRPFFSVVVMIWSFVVMVTWRQRQSYLAHRWGVLNHEEEEMTRPQFQGTYRRCEITKEWVAHYPTWKRWVKYLLSLSLTITVTVGTLIGILLVYANRDMVLAQYLNSGSMEGFSLELSIGASSTSSVPLTEETLKDPTFWLIVVGFPSVIGLSLPLLNFIFMNISVLLNNFENYRTESQYRNHLIVKVFSFRFVCYFASLYYYAFLTTESQSATESNIMRVSATLLVYLTISHWWMLLVTIYFPVLFHRWRLHRYRERLRGEIRTLNKLENEEKSFDHGRQHASEESAVMLANKKILLAQAQQEVWEETMLPLHNRAFHEYVYLVVQFGYVTCFSVVFPMTPLICLLNHLVSMRLDAYKLCRSRKRPLVHKTGGIGVWEHVLHIVTVVAVLTNCALMAFTSSLFRTLQEKVGSMGLFLVVVGWEHVMLLIKYVMQSAVSSTPKSVKDSLKKERYQTMKQRNFNMRAKKRRRSVILMNENHHVKTKENQSSKGSHYEPVTTSRLRKSQSVPNLTTIQSVSMTDSEASPEEPHRRLSTTAKRESGVSVTMDSTDRPLRNPKTSEQEKKESSRVNKFHQTENKELYHGKNDSESFPQTPSNAASRQYEVKTQSLTKPTTTLRKRSTQRTIRSDNNRPPRPTAGQAASTTTPKKEDSQESDDVGKVASKRSASKRCSGTKKPHTSPDPLSRFYPNQWMHLSPLQQKNEASTKSLERFFATSTSDERGRLPSLGDGGMSSLTTFSIDDSVWEDQEADEEAALERIRSRLSGGCKSKNADRIPYAKRSLRRNRKYA